MVESIQKEIRLCNYLENISIGTNIEYMEKCFGVPKFHYIDEESGIEENVYFTEKEIIRAYFVNEKLEGYFITKVEDRLFFDLELPRVYRDLVEDEELGKFSFYDIYGKPQNITAYATMGYSHYLYCEEYYFGSAGRYREFYFGYFDYGTSEGIEYEPDYADDEIDSDLYGEYNGIYLVNRKKTYPNTYGICSGGYYEEIFSLVSNYYQFDWEL